MFDAARTKQAALLTATALLLSACVAAPPKDAQFLPSQAQFEMLFPQRIDFYSYEGFVQAVRSFPAFAGSGSDVQRRQEMAAFLANIAHESDELKAVREYNQANYDKYCSLEAGQTCAPGQQYYGRGPIQLSWNYQYLAAGRAIGLDLWADPDRVARDSKVAWQTALWYWMNQNGPGSMTPHQAMVNGAGFGETIRSINGALECGQPVDSYAGKQVARRIDFYQRASAKFEVTPGVKLGC
ncbi:chitinase [Roseateles oligotrophus]|uniref:Chitinase n=1 Tax=Roseateles oligotrophus TaxID=1769250 RepID=A0ABT2YKN3_9BURK|nr:chitinase [Roseateles oligotrophus]MCV2370495.1 chitinase [Roseateles oligotrophus]